MGSYSGTLPCADCEGIKTELFIYLDNTYVLKETYLGKGDGKPFESTGKINTERGYDKDNDATVYVLNYDKPGQERYFVRFTNKGNKLVMLDKERKMIESKLNYSLDKL
ncbi:Lipoprotein NlpE precursor [compost metagenome]